MRRALNVMAGLGPQESETNFHHPYDHPHFGQIFLSMLGLSDYYPLSNKNIESLWMFPRLFMGVLSVIDTFLVYKIAEARYGNSNSNTRRIAFVASLLFAVMPMNWFTRRVWLESIQLPLILLSILFAVRERPSGSMSGIFLGLAIFTKIPAITIIPLTVYLSKSWKVLLPALTIPLIWPLYAVSVGELDNWYSDIFWQSSRTTEGDTVSEVLWDVFTIDPLLLSLGIAGLLFSIIRKDLFILLWIFPFVIFSYIIVHASYWYTIPLMPALCISASRLLVFLTKSRTVLSIAVVAGIVVFGLVSTTLLITVDVTSSYFQAAKYIAHIVNNADKNSQKMLVTGGISLATYTWYLQTLYPNHDFRLLHILFSSKSPINSSSAAVFLVDKPFQNTINALNYVRHVYDLGNYTSTITQILKIYNATQTTRTFEGNAHVNNNYTYPYYSMKFNNQLTPSGLDRIEIRQESK